MTNRPHPTPFTDWHPDIRLIVHRVQDEFDAIIFDLGGNTPEQYDAARARLTALLCEALGGSITHDRISE